MGEEISNADYPKTDLPTAVIDRFGKYVAFVVTDDECHTPHFHVIEKEFFGRPDWGTAIGIERFGYVKGHGSGEELPDDAIDELILAIRKKIPGFGLSVWDMASFAWNMNNADYPLASQISIPERFIKDNEE